MDPLTATVDLAAWLTQIWDEREKAARKASGGKRGSEWGGKP
jgi:hypothetical protein